jgi:hypothetical protein
MDGEARINLRFVHVLEPSAEQGKSWRGPPPNRERVGGALRRIGKILFGGGAEQGRSRRRGVAKNF